MGTDDDWCVITAATQDYHPTWLKLVRRSVLVDAFERLV
jgi:hypothetical protein